MTKLLILFKLGALFGLGLLLGAASAQNMTHVAVSVQDAGGQQWTNGSISYSFKNNGQYTNQYQFNGAPLANQWLEQTVVQLDASGGADFSIPTSTAISPANSAWTFTVCPNASTQCSIIVIPTIGGVQDISTTVNANLSVIQVGVQPMPLAYSDDEIKVVPAQAGIYYNTTSQQPKYWTGTTWMFFGGAASGCINMGDCILSHPSGDQIITNAHRLTINGTIIDTDGGIIPTRNITNSNGIEIGSTGTLAGSACGTNIGLEFRTTNGHCALGIGADGSASPGTVYIGGVIDHQPEVLMTSQSDYTDPTYSITDTGQVQHFYDIYRDPTNTHLRGVYTNWTDLAYNTLGFCMSDGSSTHTGTTCTPTNLAGDTTGPPGSNTTSKVNNGVIPNSSPCVGTNSSSQFITATCGVDPAPTCSGGNCYIRHANGVLEEWGSVLGCSTSNAPCQFTINYPLALTSNTNTNLLVSCQSTQGNCIASWDTTASPLLSFNFIEVAAVILGGAGTNIVNPIAEWHVWSF
jgi:hypothetical protein